MSQDKDMQPLEELPPLDAFERQWIGKFAEPDTRSDGQPSHSADHFVQAVLDRHASSQAAPAVIGRIGRGRLPYAAAAAVLIGVLIGWYVLTQGDPAANDPTKIVEKQSPAAPDNASEAIKPIDQTSQPLDPTRVAKADPTKIQLGRLIAQTQASVTQPATSLPQTVTQTPDAISLDKLLNLINSPIPNLSELLAPLKQPDDQQSRA